MAEAPDEPLDALLPYYAYELRDPRDNAVFYVGKGTRNRANAHDVDDADEGLVGLAGSPKEEWIRTIKRAGFDGPLRIIVGRYGSSAEAFAVEATLIKWVYGFDRLTNLVHGHRHRSIRPIAQRDAWHADDDQPYPHIDGIDRPQRMPGFRDGAYTREQQRQAVENGIEDKLLSLRDDMRALFAGTKIEVSDPDLSTPQDCEVRVHNFSISMLLVLKMQLTGKHVRVYCAPLSRDASGVASFRAALRVKVPGLEVTNYGRQAQIGSYIERQLTEGQASRRSKGISVENRAIVGLIVRKAVELLT